MKDDFQILAWIATVVAAVFAIFQWRKNLRWKQAEMAKTCLDEIWNDRFAFAALKMLDWTGLSFPLPDDGGNTPQISHEQRRASLRVANTEFPAGDPGPFIRDAYDRLFDGFERLEHFIRIKLIRFEDVEPRLRYYVGKLGTADERPVAEIFLSAYDFKLALSFLERFASWNPDAA
ncbi:MAG: hypothetical protein QOF62_280 [Pyrinomonadaceae bacterium]|nr:hypothetical protein [Pyrinomonadaceae bacterium]